MLSSAHAKVKVAPVFGDHMVLQRDMEVPIWGTADKGEKVLVEFAGQKKETKAGDDGKWMVELDPMKVSAEGRILTVSGTQFSNVVVGEVWVGSGQSNMGWPLWLCLIDLCVANAHDHPARGRKWAICVGLRDHWLRKGQ